MKSSTARLIPLVLALLAVCATGCGKSASHSPAVDVLGSYFPAWIICVASGLALTLISHQLLIACQLHAYLRPAPIVYPSLTAIFTLLTWLAFFRN